MHRFSISRVGGAAMVASATLLLIKSVLDLQAGPPPSDGTAIMAWLATHSRALPWISEILFFATVLLVPGVVALFKRLADTHPATTVVGCGLMAVVISLLTMLLVVHGRLVFPVFGMRVRTPDIAELVIAVFYGGWHAVLLLLAVATFALSLALWSNARVVASLGFITSVADIIGSYPDHIGPVLTFVTQLFLVAWFAAVGVYLSSASPPGRMLRDPNF